jgi:Fe-S-cluster containining protein
MNPTSRKGSYMPQENKGKTCSYDVCRECEINCCRDAKPPLTENRKQTISRFIEEQRIAIENPFAVEAYSYLSTDKEMWCIFNDKETKRCIIHPVKPETCVAGPITFDIDFANRRVRWFLKKASICAYAGLLYENKAAFEAHYAVAKKRLLDLIKKLSAEELRALNRIDEPETCKVGEDDLPHEVAEKLGL